MKIHKKNNNGIQDNAKVWQEKRIINATKQISSILTRKVLQQSATLFDFQAN